MAQAIDVPLGSSGKKTGEPAPPRPACGTGRRPSWEDLCCSASACGCGDLSITDMLELCLDWKCKDIETYDVHDMDLPGQWHREHRKPTRHKGHQ
jgi:hypothetical protein